MDLKKLFTEERAVSPVIGVILMVAITVILAAVIGAFVLGLGGETQESPQVSLSFSENPAGNLTVEHRGGDAVDHDDIEVRGSGEDADWPETSGQFRAGESVSFDVNSGAVRIVWTGGSDDAVLGSFEAEGGTG